MAAGLEAYIYIGPRRILRAVFESVPLGVQLAVSLMISLAYDAAVLAADYTVSCIEATQGDPEHWYGVKFETVLPEYIRALA